MNYNYVYVIFIIIIMTFSSGKVKSYPDTPGTDVIIDAPWRTVRDYVPVLFFLPEGKPVSYVNSDFFLAKDRRISYVKPDIAVYAYNPQNNDSRLIFKDPGDDGQNQFGCSGIKFLSSEGKVRHGTTTTENIDKFWHYIARIPVSCLGFGNTKGKRGEHFLKANFSNSTKLLRVVVSNTVLPKLNVIDQHYDVHVHTIAEQTKWHGLTNGDSARLKYGGPIAMLLDSAYALGMTDTKLTNANWSDFKNQIVTTDHNGFFSGNPYDAGTSPGHGPTAHKNEFDWYRKNFGDLGAEEVTVQGARGHYRGSPGYNALKGKRRQGSHLLSYGAEHFEGPWHGGRFNTGYTKMGANNDITITKAIQKIGSTNGFGYASHPESHAIGWTENYYHRAIGFKYYDTDKKTMFDLRDGGIDSPILDITNRDFTFKGLQVWNERKDKVARKNKDGKKFTTSVVGKLVPFSIDNSQSFIHKPNWNLEHVETEMKFKNLMAIGLNYSFKQKKQHRFIRKLFMSAGTDSHGDFNYSVEGDPPALVIANDADWSPKDWLDTFLDTLSFLADVSDLDLENDNFTDYEHISLSNNGFGRLRTYALTSERYITQSSTKKCQKNFPFCNKPTPKVGRQSVLAYKEGNTIITDGPIATFSLDGNCRFNSETMVFHDAYCAWENFDGMIGGRGAFDAGNTMLALKSNENVSLKYHWLGENFFLPDPSQTKYRSNDMEFNLEHIFGSGEYHTAAVKFRAKGRHFDHDESILDLVQHNNGNTLLEQNVGAKDTYINSAFILSGKLRKNSANETRFVTNPIWSSHTTIDVNAPSGCPIKPGGLKITAKFSLSMNTKKPKGRFDKTKAPTNSGQYSKYFSSKKSVTNKKEKHIERHIVAGNRLNNYESKNEVVPYKGMKVLIKPLSGNGKSGTKEFIISNDKSKWESNTYFNTSGDIVSKEIIADAMYSTTNRIAIPCGGAWDSTIHKKGKNRTSYAVVLSDIKDMHNNPLNSVASTFTVFKKASIRDGLRNKRKVEEMQNKTKGQL